MEDEIEDISLEEDEEKPKEEPWCLTCRGYTDYRRKWSTVSRADLDGRTYSENSEVPHCIACGNRMLLISHCRILVSGINIFSLSVVILAIMCSFVLFEFSAISLFGLLPVSLLAFGLTRIPQKSRRWLREWRIWKEEQGILELAERSLDPRETE